MTRLIQTAFLIALGLSCPVVYAAQCADVFPTAISSASTTGTINIGGGAEVYNSPSNQLVTKNLSQNGATGCGAVVCTKSDTAASTATEVTTFPSGASVYVNYQEVRSFTPQNFTSLSANSRAVLNFAPGDYTINSDMILASEAKINVSSAGTVRLFISGRFELGSLGQLNMSGDATKIVYIYTRSSFSLLPDAKAKAIVYAKGNVALNNNTALEGVITSGAAVSMQFGAVVTYNGSFVANADLGVSCQSRFLKEYVIDVGTGVGSTCQSHAVTITAKDNLGNIYEVYDGTVNLTTSRSNGNWTKTSNSGDALGLLSATTNDSGVASYKFTTTDAGVITLNLSNTHKETMTVTGADTAAAVSSTSAALAFSDNVFVVEPIDVLGDDLIAGRSHQFRARMLKTDPVSGVCAAADGYNVAGIKAWLQRAAEDPGGAAPQLTAGNTLSLPSAEPASSNATLNFSSGVAAFSLLASDVGKYTLQLKDAGLSYADVPIIGGSAALIARPFALALTVAGNTAASSANGSVFRKAGELFTVNISGVAWQTEDDNNPLDGQADGHANSIPADNANLADNSVLASFGNENTSVNVQLGSVLQLPTGGADPGLAGSTLVGAGAGAAQVSFGEVGIVQLNASIAGAAYMGASAARVARMSSTSGYVGRFVPDHLQITEQALEPACTSALDFTYLDQFFGASYKARAVNVHGVVTSNYVGDFAKLQHPQIESSFKANKQADGTILDSRLVFDAANSYLWQADGLSADTRLNVARVAGFDSPFGAQLGVAPVDTDGVGLALSALNFDANNDGAVDSLALGSAMLRFGRLRLADSFGPETANLPVEFVTEYWNGLGWQRNADDSCTAIAKSSIGYPGGPLSAPANGTVGVGSGSTTGVYPLADSSVVGFSNGDAQHYFTAPGQGSTGSFNVAVDLSAYPWLQFDWNGDGNNAESALPTATFTFGAYRGHDRVLYWQEVLN